MMQKEGVFLYPSGSSELSYGSYIHQIQGIKKNPTKQSLTFKCDHLTF